MQYVVCIRLKLSLLILHATVANAYENTIRRSDSA